MNVVYKNILQFYFKNTVRKLDCREIKIKSGAGTETITHDVLFTCWKKAKNFALSCLTVNSKTRKWKQIRHSREAQRFLKEISSVDLHNEGTATNFLNIKNLKNTIHMFKIFDPWADSFLIKVILHA